MTLGDGIFWSTALILLAAGIYLVTTRKKWKLVGKLIAVLVVTGAVTAGGVWGWSKYQKRPMVVDELSDIKLGMSQVDVSLLKGYPPKVFEPNLEDPGPYAWVWRYGSKTNTNWALSVKFLGDDYASSKVVRICEQWGFKNLLGIYKDFKEQTVINRLGEPTHTSINWMGTSKYLSFAQWQVAYKIKAGSVSEVCVTQEGKVVYGLEYGDPFIESELPRKPQ